jgi:hypothetical protein
LRIYYLYCKCSQKSQISQVTRLFHHALSILHHAPLHCPAALPGSLARQPCPAALPGSLARQPCPAALPGSLARQPEIAKIPTTVALYKGPKSDFLVLSQGFQINIVTLVHFLPICSAF